MKERDIIEALAATALRRDDVVFGIGDDGAVLQLPPGKQMVTVMDTVVAGVHFPQATAAADIAYRALTVNVSDMAAMGATPAWATLAMTLPSADAPWIRSFASGWAEAASEFNVALVGGDTVRGPLNVCVALHGFVNADEAVLRSGAQCGDAVYVTGTLGDAAAGLAILQDRLAATEPAAAELVRRFLRPAPRLRESADLAGNASAALDLSDSLVTDAGRLAAASRVALALDTGALPLSRALLDTAGKARARQFALTGGDDYELLFTVRASATQRFEQACKSWRCRCTRIGEVQTGEGVRLFHRGEPVPLPEPRFEHFSAAH